MEERFVIIGAGQAGGWAAKTLRDRGHRGPIVLIGDEAHPPYERPPLSKAVLCAGADPKTTYLFTAESLKALDLDLRLGVQATGIDRHRRVVDLADGECVSYEKLLLCTGGRPRPLSVSGERMPGVFMLRTIEDAVVIRKALRVVSSVAVIGGGWIGLEIAAAARHFDVEVTVIELGSRLCARTVPPEISAALANLHSRHGTEVLLDTSVTRITPESAGLQLTLNSGQELLVDMVVVGVGLLANDDLARKAGLECQNGILVDEHCQTSDEYIFAAGDVAVAPNRWTGGRLRLESWQNAQNQGIAAASAALGVPSAYDPLPWFWSDQYDTNIQIYGAPGPEREVVVRGDPNDRQFVFFYLAGDRLVAAVGFNSARDLSMARRLIEKQVSVARSVLRDVAQPVLRAANS